MNQMEKRKAAVAMRLGKAKISINKTAQTLEVARSTVIRVVERFKERHNFEVEKGRGRKRERSSKDDAEIECALKRPETSSLRKLACAASETDQFDLSKSTIHRSACESGMRFVQPTKKPRMSDKHKANRLAFANKYLPFAHDTAFLNKLVFTDEKWFTVNGTTKGVWISANEEPPRHSTGKHQQLCSMHCRVRAIPFVRATEKHPKKAMGIGAFTRAGVFPLWFPPPGVTVTAPVYQDVVVNWAYDAVVTFNRPIQDFVWIQVMRGFCNCLHLTDWLQR